MSHSRSFGGEATVLIVDDHTPMREALRACIERSFSRLLIIEAPDGVTALKYVEVHRPSLVLMDINLPDVDGVDLTRAIMRLWPTTFVAAISIDASADLPARAQAAGAVDFIAKDQVFEALVPLVGAAFSLTNGVTRVDSDSRMTAVRPSVDDTMGSACPPMSNDEALLQLLTRVMEANVQNTEMRRQMRSTMNESQQIRAALAAGS